MAAGPRGPSVRVGMVWLKEPGHCFRMTDPKADEELIFELIRVIQSLP